MIMGWGTHDVLGAAFNHQQMAILDASDELHTFAAFPLIDGLSQFLIQIFNQDIGIVGFQITPIMCDNLAISQCDDITADGEIVICHLIADTGSLKRSASFINFIQIITQNRGIGHF